MSEDCHDWNNPPSRHHLDGGTRRFGTDFDKDLLRSYKIKVEDVPCK